MSTFAVTVESADEQVHPLIGRLFIKQRYPVYLEKTGF